MAAASVVNIPADRILRDSVLRIDVRLTGVRRWRFRLWLGARLIALAARVMGMREAVVTIDREDLACGPASSGSG